MIATTLEMSKRLMDAEVRLESADMAWVRRKVYNHDGGKVEWMLAVGWFKLYGSIEDGNAFPAWSIGALWDIIHEHNHAFVYDTGEESAEDLLESLVTRLEAMASLDFI